ncbi:MAG TPA: Xaa-Pro peptidase family protein [Candidatus Saccharimonadales bacterium]
MDKSLTKAFFKANRDRLFKNLSADILIITANGLLQKTADQAFPFRQDSNFWYLTGLSEPDLILVKTSREEFIIIPDFYVKRQSILSSTDNKRLSDISGVEQILNEKEGWQKVKDLTGNNSKIATLLPNPVLLKHYGIYSSPVRRQLTSRLKRLYPRNQMIDARTALAAMRMVKQPVEIGIIQRAIDMTSETLVEVLNSKRLAGYRDTGQIEKDILAGFITRGADGHGFDPIVAAGANAAMIHYSKLSEPLNPNELIVCDVGAVYSFYSADITRTVSYGQPSSRQQAVYEAVKHVQAEAFKLIKPGIKLKEYEKQVEGLVGQQLKALGLITKLDSRSIRQYYPHACSHSLGIDTHDSADYSLALPENMVMTVEPGIYIPEEGIGVRIEDVIRLTKNSYELMSSKLPVSLNL